MLVDPQAPPKDSHPWKDANALKHWKPIHDQVLALHLAGYQNRVIAERTGYTEPYICKILKDPRAEKAIARIRKRMAELARTDIENRLSLLAAEGLDRIETTIRADIPATSKSKPHQDKAAFKVLEMAGYGKNVDESARGGIQLSPEGERRLVDAMEKSAEVTRIHEMEEGKDFFVTEEE